MNVGHQKELGITKQTRGHELTVQNNSNNKFLSLCWQYLVLKDLLCSMKRPTNRQFILCRGLIEQLHSNVNAVVYDTAFISIEKPHDYAMEEPLFPKPFTPIVCRVLSLSLITALQYQSPFLSVTKGNNYCT